MAMLSTMHSNAASGSRACRMIASLMIEAVVGSLRLGKAPICASVSTTALA